MDDFTFEQWSATLLELRQSRHDAIKLQIDERGKDYGAKDLFDYLMVSLDQIMSQWWEFERRSWETTPPADPALAAETLRNELESVSDFEIEASNKDVDAARELTPLQDDEIEKGREDLKAFLTDLKKTYGMKIDSLFNTIKKAPPTQPVPTTAGYAAPRGGSYGRSSGSGLGLLIMFFVGLGLGTGIALFFRDSAKKSEQMLKEEKEKLAGEKREIMSEYTTLQETYFQLASGKLLTLPEIDRMMRPIREDAIAKKRQAEADFVKTREALLKKVPAGDRLDRSLSRLENEKTARLKEIENQMNARLERYLKQKQIHEELMEKE